MNHNYEFDNFIDYDAENRRWSNIEWTGMNANNQWFGSDRRFLQKDHVFKYACDLYAFVSVSFIQQLAQLQNYFHIDQ